MSLAAALSDLDGDLMTLDRSDLAVVGDQIIRMALDSAAAAQVVVYRDVDGGWRRIGHVVAVDMAYASLNPDRENSAAVTEWMFSGRTPDRLVRAARGYFATARTRP